MNNRNSKPCKLILSVLLAFMISVTLLSTTAMAFSGTELENQDYNISSFINYIVSSDLTYTKTADITMVVVMPGMDALLEVQTGATLTIEGEITINSNHYNDSFLVRPGGTVVIANDGVLTLNGVSSIDGNVINYGDLILGSDFKKQITGTVTNYGTITNEDKIITAGGAVPLNEITDISATPSTTENSVDVELTGTLPTDEDRVYIKAFDAGGSNPVSSVSMVQVTSDGTSATGTLDFSQEVISGSETYTIKTGFDGRNWLKSTQVTLTAMPVIAVQGSGGTAIPYNGSLVLEMTNEGNFNSPTYKWYKDNVEILGEIDATLTAADAGSYKAEVTADGRVNESNEIVLTEMPEPLDPNVTSDDPLEVTVGADRTFTVFMGQGTWIATGASIVSADPGIAAVAVPSITADGLITVQGVSPGQTTISISYSGGSRDGETDTVNVTVNPVPLDSSVTADDPLEVTVGADRTFTVYMGQGTATATSAAIVSTDPGIASVGVSSITADETITVQGVSPGQTTISVSYSGGSRDGETDTVNVTVNPPINHPVPVTVSTVNPPANTGNQETKPEIILLVNEVTHQDGTISKPTLSGIYNSAIVRGCVITTPLSDLEAAAGLTPDLKGSGAKLKYYVCDSRPSITRTLLTEAAVKAGYKLAGVINADLYLIQQGLVTPVREVNTETTLVIGIQESLRKEGRRFSLICFDSKGNQIVLTDTDSDNQTITVNTSVFGLFAICYQD